MRSDARKKLAATHAPEVGAEALGEEVERLRGSDLVLRAQVEKQATALFVMHECADSEHAARMEAEAAVERVRALAAAGSEARVNAVRDNRWQDAILLDDLLAALDGPGNPKAGGL